MTDQERWAIDRLVALGWMSEPEPGTPFLFEAAIVEYQAWAQLPQTGELDQATIDSLQRPRFCGHPDRMTVEEVRRSPRASWLFAGPSLPTVSDVVMLQTVQNAFDAWSKVAPILAHRASGSEPLSLSIATLRMDGRNGVLADCELPGPSLQHMRIDNSEGWGTAIKLLNVLCHELGHFWGIGHLSTPGSLMNPYYAADISTPQAGDISAIQQLYPGSPALPPTPTPPTPPVPGDHKVTIDIVNPQPNQIRIYLDGVLQKVGQA